MPDDTSRGELVIRTEREHDLAFLELYGELDLASAPLLEQRLRAAEATALGWVLVDLSGLEFIDITGVHALLNSDQRLVGNGRALSLLRGPAAVHRVFELTNLDRVLQFDD